MGNSSVFKSNFMFHKVWKHVNPAIIKIIAESDKDSDEENAKVPPLRGNDSRSNRMLQINMMTKKSADNATQSFAGALS